MKYSGQLCQVGKRYCSLRGQYNQRNEQLGQRESYCVLGRAGLLGVVTAKAGCWMRELVVVWHVSLSPSKRSVRPMPVICRFISGFVYLMYNASIISNRLKSFSCLIILVLLTICSLFNVLLWKSWLCLSGAPDWRCIVILRERVVRVYPIYAWGSQSPTLHSYLYRWKSFPYIYIYNSSSYKLYIEVNLVKHGLAIARPPLNRIVCPCAPPLVLAILQITGVHWKMLWDWLFECMADMATLAAKAIAMAAKQAIGTLLFCQHSHTPLLYLKVLPTQTTGSRWN